MPEAMPAATPSVYHFTLKRARRARSDPLPEAFQIRGGLLSYRYEMAKQARKSTQKISDMGDAGPRRPPIPSTPRNMAIMRKYDVRFSTLTPDSSFGAAPEGNSSCVFLGKRLHAGRI
jgi:hypothetical protein